MIKALLLFSGGLDSILSAKILVQQKIKIFLLCFKSAFFDCHLAKESAKKLGLKLKICDISKEHLKIVKEPTYGYGQGINPCRDCHLLMLKKAKQIFAKEKYDFIAIGDVLGQRPFSQNKNVFEIAEKTLNFEGLILRPLCARLLKPTIPEKKGLIKREKLLGFQGKSRKSQLKLAQKYKIKDIPSPAGGCILTDPIYAQQLKKLFEKIPNCDERDCRLLRKGRNFWLNNFLMIVGRNERENQQLKKSKSIKDSILEPKNFSGPTVLIRGFSKKIAKSTLARAKNLIFQYSKKIPKEPKFLRL